VFGSLFSSTAFAAEQAAELTADCVFTPSQNTGDAWALQDGNRTTRYRSSGKTSVAITSGQPFSYLYIVWETPPKPWKMTTAQGDVTYGAHGFIHEAVELPAPQAEVTLTLESDQNTICDIYVFAAGELPPWVQRWQTPYDDADMLLLPTHADDEHLFFGGTMPYYAGERGLKVQVAYLTNHWAEPYRPHELLDGLWQVGVSAYPVLSDFVDVYASSLEQAKGLYPEEAVTAFQVEQLRRFKPEVVVGHDVNGEYGHGVHIYNTYTLQKAIEISNDPAQYPQSAEQYGIWDVPKTYLHLFNENAVLMDWNIPLERFGGKTAIDIAKEGFAKHVSQQKYFQVEDYGPYDCRKFGLYRSTVGPDVVGGDFCENIDFSPPAPQQPAEEPPKVSEHQPAPQPEEQHPTAEQGNGRAVLAAIIACAVVAALMAAAVIFTLKKGKKAKH